MKLFSMVITGEKKNFATPLNLTTKCPCVSNFSRPLIFKNKLIDVQLYQAFSFENRPLFFNTMHVTLFHSQTLTVAVSRGTRCLSVTESLCMSRSPNQEESLPSS